MKIRELIKAKNGIDTKKHFLENQLNMLLSSTSFKIFFKLKKIESVISFLQIKDSIVKSVSDIEVRNLQSLTQVTSVIARATLEPSEVTFDTQVSMTRHMTVTCSAPITLLLCLADIFTCFNDNITL